MVKQARRISGQMASFFGAAKKEAPQRVPIKLT